MEPALGERSLVLKVGVEQYIFNGANLMWPGTIRSSSPIVGVANIDSMGNYAQEEIVVVRAANGTAVAVGKLACNTSIVKTASEKKGNAVKVLHFLGDELWNAGSGQDRSVAEETKKEQAPEAKKEGKEEEKKLPLPEEQKATLPQAEQKAESSVPLPLPVPVATPAPEQKTPTEPKKEEVSAEEEKRMDEAVFDAFMTAIKISLAPTDLPMEPSTLMNPHMKTCSSVPLNFRNSSYKRVRLVRLLTIASADREIPGRDAQEGDNSVRGEQRRGPCASPAHKRGESTVPGTMQNR